MDNKFYGACGMTKETLDKINSHIRETLDHYYKDHDTDSFFHIVDLLDMCKSQEFTKEEIPALIEMTNVIVMG